MGKSVDNKVVEMRFDNSNFEQNAKTSLSTLDKLKNALSNLGGSKGLEDLNKAAGNVNLSPISESVEKVKGSFNALETLAVGALLKIGSQAVTLGEQMIYSLSFEQINAGFTKYEQKTQNVQTLLNSTGKSVEEINGYLADLMWYSDETSFGFTDMTAALSTMTSSGGDIEKLIPMIEGIGNATAFAGKGATEFSRVIYNLNQSYSQGALSTMDWRSVEMAGAASKQLKEYLIEAAEQVGTIKKGTGDIADWANYLSGKKITSEAMEIAFTRFAEYTQAVKQAVDDGTYETATEAMEKMSTEGFDDVSVKAMNAAQNAKSFSEAIDATKDAVSSGWMRIFDTIFGDIDQATELWTLFCGDLWDIFASGFDDKQNFIEELFLSPFDKLKNEIESTGVVYDDFEKSLEGVLKNHGVQVDYLVRRYGSLTEALSEGHVSAEYISEALISLAIGGDTAGESIDNLTGKYEDFNKVVQDVIKGNYSNGEARKAALEAAGYEYEKIQDLVNKALKGEKIAIEDLNEEQLVAIGYTQEQAAAITKLGQEALQSGTRINDLIKDLGKPSGRTLLFDSLRNVLLTLAGAFDAVKEAFSEVFPSKSVSDWYSLLEAINTFTRNVLNAVTHTNKLKRTFKGLFSVFDMGIKIVKAILKPILTFLKDIGLLKVNVLDATASLGDFLVELDNSEGFMKALSTITETTTAVLSKFATIINSALPRIKQAYTDAGGGIKGAFAAIKEAVKMGVDASVSKLKELTGIDLASWSEKCKTGISNFGSKSKKIFVSLKTYLLEHSTLVRTLSTLIDRLSTPLGKLKTSIKNLNFKEIKENLKEIKDRILDCLGEGPRKVIETLIELFQRIGTTVSDILVAIINGDWETVKNKFKDLLGIFVEIINCGIGGFFEILNEVIRDSSGTLGTFIDCIKSLDVDWGKLGLIVGLGAIIIEINKFIKLINGVEKQIAPITGLIQNITGVFSSLQKTIKAWKTNIQAGTILKIAISIGILCGALAILSKMNQEDLRQAAISMSMVVGAISVFTFLIGFVKNPTALITAATNFIAIAGAMYLTVLAFKELCKIDVSDMESHIWYFVGIFAAVSAVAIAMTVISGKFGATKGQTWMPALNIIAICAGLYLACLSIKKICEIPADQLSNGVMALIPLFGMLTLVALAMSTCKTGGGGISVLALVASIWLFEKALKYVIEEGVSFEDVKAHLNQIGVVLGLLAALCVTTRLAGKNTAGTALTILALVAAIWLLVKIIHQINELDVGEIAKGIIVIGLLSVFMSAMLKNTKGVKPEAFKTVAAVAVALVVAVIALLVLSMLDIGELASSVIALTVVMYALSNLLNSTKKMDSKGVWTILAVMVGLTAIALAMNALAQNDWKSIVAAGLSMTAVITMLSVLLKTISSGSGLGNEKTVKGKLKVILATMGGLALIAYTMSFLANNDWKSIAAAGLSMSAVMGVMIGLIAVLEDAKFNASSILAVIEAIALMGTAAVLLNMLAQNPWEQMLSAAVSLSLVLITMAGVIAIMGLISPVAVEGVAGLIVLIGTIALIVAAISAISNEQTIAAVQRGSEMMRAVGEFFGNIIAGFVDAATSSLPEVGQHMTDFMTNAQGFIDGLSKIDSKVAEGAKSLATAIIQITKAEFINGIASILGIEIDENTFKKLAKAVNTFAENTKDVNPTHIEKVANATKALFSALSQMPITGGWLGKLLCKDLGDFSDDLVQFAIAIGMYSIQAKTIDTEAMNKANKPIKDLFDTLSELPINGGWLGKIIGKDLGEYATDLAQFAYAITTYSLQAAKIDTEAIKKTDPVLTELFETLNKMPANGGFLGWILGKDLGKFSEHLVAFAKAVKEYSWQLNSATLSKITESDPIISELFSVLSQCPSAGNLLDKIFGTSDLEVFAKNLGNLGKGLADYATAVANVNVLKIGATAVALGELLEAISGITVSGGLLSKIFNKDDISQLENALPSLARGIVGYATEIANQSFDIKKIEDSADCISTLMTVMKDIQPDGGLLDKIFGDGNPFSDFGDNLSNLAQAMVAFGESATNIEDINNALDTAKKVIEFAKSISEGDIDAATTQLTAIEAFMSQASYIGDLYQPFIDGMQQATDAMIATVTTTCNNSQPTMTTCIVTIANYINTAIVTNFIPVVTLSMENAIKALIKVLTDSKQQFTDTLDEIEEELETVSVENTETIQKAIEDAVNTMSDSLILLIETLCNTIVTKTKEILTYDEFYDIGSNIVQGLVDAINDGQSEVVNAIVAMCEAAVAEARNTLGVESPSKEFIEIGEYVDEGFAKGINNGKSLKAMSSVCDSMIKTTRKTFGIHSPSKLFHKFGEYIDQGFAGGIKDKFSLVQNQMDNMKESAMNAYDDMQKAWEEYCKAYMAQYEEYMRQYMEYQKQQEQNGGENPETGENPGTDTGTTPTTIEIPEKVQKDISSILTAVKSNHTSELSTFNSFKTRIYSELGQIKEAISDAASSNSNMQVVMDTGALVGSITNEMDSSLGRKAAKAKRGN